jgi:hypothetical protein
MLSTRAKRAWGQNLLTRLEMGRGVKSGEVAACFFEWIYCPRIIMRSKNARVSSVRIFAPGADIRSSLAPGIRTRIVVYVLYYIGTNNSPSRRYRIIIDFVANSVNWALLPVPTTSKVRIRMASNEYGPLLLLV